jgi:hypothetical protein
MRLSRRRLPQCLALSVVALTTSPPGHTSLVAALRRTPAAQDVFVHFPGANNDERPLLLYSGRRDGKCRKFEMHVGKDMPDLTLENTSYDSACPVEVDVFAPGFGAFGRSLTDSNVADKAWLDGGLSSGKMEIPLPSHAPVPVTIWIVASAAERGKAVSLFDRQMSIAEPILKEMGAGLLVTYPGGLQDLVLSAKPDCKDGDGMSADAARYTAHTLNVYYVKNYLNAAYGSYAITCWLEGHPEIIFVSWGNQNTPDIALAHEFGHALGLTHPNSIGGHTYDVSGFNDYNLMRTGAASITNISVGQMYHMNFSADTWFNGGLSSTPRAVIHKCQDTWNTGPCAKLKLFKSKWPP